MKFIIDNNSTTVVIGGKDNLGGSLRDKLYDFLVVKNENSFHVNRFLAKKNPKSKFRVEGYHRLLLKNNTFPTGLLPMVVGWATKLGVTMTFEDVRENLPIFKREMDFSTPGFELYEHQKELVKSLYNVVRIGDNDLYFPRGQWDAATNSGKTAAAGVVVKNIINPKAILLVDSQGLFEQHIEYYETVFSEIGKIGSVHVGYTRNGNAKYEYQCDIKYPFTIAMVGTLHSRLIKDRVFQHNVFNMFNILICDESHGFAGKEAATVVQRINAGVRLFMSGTPLAVGDRMTKAKLISMSGRVLKEVTKKYLMDNGFSMKAHVRIYLNPTIPTFYQTYRDEETAIIRRSIPRAELVADLIAKRTKRKVLITFWEKAHGYLMYTTFIEKYPDLTDKAAWVYGDDPERPQKIKDYIDGKIQFLFTSTIMRQGINVKDIQTIIDCIGGKDIVELSQFMGRGERLDGINKDFEYINFFDRGAKLTSHSLRRIKFYFDEELPVKFMYEATKTGRPKK